MAQLENGNVRLILEEEQLRNRLANRSESRLLSRVKVRDFAQGVQKVEHEREQRRRQFHAKNNHLQKCKSALAELQLVVQVICFLVNLFKLN